MSRTIRRCWRSLTSDRTRLSLTIAFAAVGLLFWARLIVIQDMPRTAVADPDAVIELPASRNNDATTIVPGPPDPVEAAPDPITPERD